MRKIFLAVAVTVGLMSAATVQGAVPKAEVNGQEIELSATPYETGGAVMVPLMDFMHVFNTDMAYWDGETKSAYMDDGLKVTAGTEEAAVIKKYGWTPGENEEYLKVYKLEKLPVIINGKMMVPVSFLEEYAQGAAEFAYDAESGYIRCYMTKIDGRYFPVLKADSQNGDMGDLEESLKKYLKYFDAGLFEADKSGYKDGDGNIVYRGKRFPQRTVTVTFLANYAINVKDNYNYAVSQRGTEGFEVKEYEEYTEIANSEFRVRLFSDKVFDVGKEITAYAEAEYIGPERSAYICHSAPCITISLKGGIYNIGGSVDNIGVYETWPKGKVYRFDLVKGGGWDKEDAAFWEEYFSVPEIYVPEGEYTLTVNFNITDAGDGREFKAAATRGITVK